MTGPGSSTRFQTASSQCYTAQLCGNFTDPPLKFIPDPGTCKKGWKRLGDTCKSSCHYGYETDPPSDGVTVEFRCIWLNDTMLYARS